MNYSAEDIDIMEDWWIKKSRRNFLAYRQFMRSGKFDYNWFIADMCKELQQFFVDLKAGKRPVLFIQAPPQHGKSWTITDFLSWVSGLLPSLRIIYSSFSDTLGIRCNTQLQRFYDSEKFQRIFPALKINQSNSVTIANKAKRNSEHIEFLGKDNIPTDGQFRNTTTRGRVTGESLDLGVIDDPVKGREEANSPTISEKTWQWFTDDFMSRFSKMGGLLIIMTRWSTLDVIGRLIKQYSDLKKPYKLRNYQAIATSDGEHRQEGDSLFPALKPLDFLKEQKAIRSQESWESLFQGNPTIAGGKMIKDHWWGWWKTGHCPPLKYKFITADTAQKAKETSDWSVFQCWGYTIDDRIILLDKMREKFESPELTKEAEMFYNKHNTPREKVGDPILRGMYIEDKSSGIGLIQTLRRKRLKVFPVPRDTDKIRRCKDAAPEIQMGRVLLNTDINDVGNLTKEAREFPNSEFDDDFDTLLTAIEVAFINEDKSNMLAAAMEAD